MIGRWARAISSELYWGDIEWQKNTEDSSRTVAGTADLHSAAAGHQDQVAAVRAVPEDVRVAPEGRPNAASAASYARRKSAASAWTRPISLTTRRLKSWRRSSR